MIPTPPGIAPVSTACPNDHTGSTSTAVGLFEVGFAVVLVAPAVVALPLRPLLGAMLTVSVLRAALGTLTVRDREVIALRFHAGLDTAEVAGVLGTTPTNAGTLLHRAMTKLREAMRHDH